MMKTRRRLYTCIFVRAFSYSRKVKKKNVNKFKTTYSSLNFIDFFFGQLSDVLNLLFCNDFTVTLMHSVEICDV